MMLHETFQWKDHPRYYFVLHSTGIEYVQVVDEYLRIYDKSNSTIQEHNNYIKKGLLHRGHAKNEINTELHNRG